MICISITARSNRFAVVDMYNAAPQCDLLELRLDRLESTPDITLLLETRQKPVLISCRRKEDGGEWAGTEERRLILLRQAVAGGADYVELEMDVAGQVPRYGKTQRVVSFTSIHEPLRDLEDLYRQASQLNADIVKFTGPVRNLEEAWPMLRVLAKAELPVVLVGLGQPGLTLSLLGRKLRSPWIDAALEQGMEAHPGQATVSQLREVYHYDAIQPQTPLVGVAGFSPQQALGIRLLNAAFAHLGLALRCLPMEMGNPGNFERMMDALHVSSVVLDAAHRSQILQAVHDLEESAQLSQQADLVLKQKKGWQGYNTVWRAAVRGLEAVLRQKTEAARPVEGLNVLLAGASATARAIAYGIQQRGGLLTVTSHDEDRAQLLAQMFQCRYVPAVRAYSTYADVLIYVDDAAPAATSEDPVTPQRPLIDAGFLRANLTVMDLRSLPNDTQLLANARVLGCPIVEPMDVFLGQLEQQLRGLTGKEVPIETLRTWLPLRPSV